MDPPAYVEAGPGAACMGTAEGSAVGRCVLLQGSRYTPDGPMLFFAAQTALARGWDVRQVWWDIPEMEEDEEVAWVGDQLDAAVDGYGGPVLLVAKSLGTLAASRAALRGYDAAWLTPLLTESDLAAPLLSYPARQLVVVGSGDPYCDKAVFDALPGDSLLVPATTVSESMEIRAAWSPVTTDSSGRSTSG